MNLAAIMNFDVNEVEVICKSDTCFLSSMKREKNEAVSILNFEEAV